MDHDDDEDNGYESCWVEKKIMILNGRFSQK